MWFICIIQNTQCNMLHVLKPEIMNNKLITHTMALKSTIVSFNKFESNICLFYPESQAQSSKSKNCHQYSFGCYCCKCFFYQYQIYKLNILIAKKLVHRFQIEKMRFGKSSNQIHNFIWFIIINSILLHVIIFVGYGKYFYFSISNYFGDANLRINTLFILHSSYFIPSINSWCSNINLN